MLRSTSVFLALSLAAGLVPGLALAQQNGPSGPVPANAVVGSLAVNGGRILCTAAINSDGTIATTRSRRRTVLRLARTKSVSKGRAATSKSKTAGSASSSPTR
jgi:hypothetical protein